MRLLLLLPASAAAWTFLLAVSVIAAAAGAGAVACSVPRLLASAHVAQYNLSLSDLRLDEEEDHGGERARRDGGRLAPASRPCVLSMIHPADSDAAIPTLAAADTAPGPEPGPEPGPRR